MSGADVVAVCLAVALLSGVCGFFVGVTAVLTGGISGRGGR